MLYWLQKFEDIKDYVQGEEELFSNAKTAFRQVDMYFEEEFFIDTEEVEDLELDHSDIMSEVDTDDEEASEEEPVSLG